MDATSPPSPWVGPLRGRPVRPCHRQAEQLMNALVESVPVTPRPSQPAANSGTSQVTQTVRAGIECGDATGCVVPPLHLSATVAFRGFAERRGYDYTRSGNPTRDLLGEALAELEQGAGAVVTASGMAAITLVGYLVPCGGRIAAPHA